MEKLAALARIALTDEEKKRFGEQLGTILNYFEQINSVDVAGVEPSSHAFPVFNILREDDAGPTLDIEAFARIAPKFNREDSHLIVPRVVDDES